MRIDRLLVARGLFESRAKAQAAIAAGLVTADDVPVSRPSEEIAATRRCAPAAAHPYVSRGGVKLAAALDHFGDRSGRPRVPRCRRFDRRVHRGSADARRTPRLRRRCRPRPAACEPARTERDIVIEGTDIRTLDPALLAEPPEIALIDVSFISLKLVLPAVHELLAPGARLLSR